MNIAEWQIEVYMRIRKLEFGNTAYRITLYKYDHNFNEQMVVTIFDPKKVNGFGMLRNAYSRILKKVVRNVKSI
jgi:RNase P protein component